MKRIPASRRPFRLFDKFNPHWDNHDRRKNAIFVGIVLGQLNDLLREQGYVFLNDALELLGFESTIEGMIVGWLRDSDPDEGDGYVSFGIWDQGFREGMDWIDGKSDLMVFRFNVDRFDASLPKRIKQLREEGRI